MTARMRASTLLAALALVLTGCFMTPGKFDSTLSLGANDSFAFTYDGEIFFLGLSQLAAMESGDNGFEPDDCHVDGTQEVRPCSANEIAGQRARWEAEQQKEKREARQVAAMMNGIEMSDPEARAKLVDLLKRQKGWNSVVDKGDGIFEVSYRIEGTLSHDFMFPMIESFPPTNPFVLIVLREDGSARIDAPGFAAQNESNPISSLFGGMAALGGMANLDPNMSDEENAMPEFPELEGSFTIRTDGAMRILANNTDEGPRPIAGGEELTWQIGPGTRSAPTALIAR